MSLRCQGWGSFSGISRVAIVAFLFLSSAAVLCHAMEFVFTKVVDTDTRIPGREDTFAKFSTPSLDGDDLVFFAAGKVDVDLDDHFLQQGIFAHLDGGLITIADEATEVPQGLGRFEAFTQGSGLPEPSIHDRKVVFRAFGENGQDGIYTWEFGALAVVVDRETVAPGGSANFQAFIGSPYIYDSEIVFAGTDTGFHQGVYLDRHGVLSTVVNHETVVPRNIRDL